MRKIRPISSEELPAYVTRVQETFTGARPSHEEIEARRPVLEPCRMLGVFESGDLVGTASTIPFQLTLPGGGPVPAAGISAITVLPTHRRQGLLTEILRRQVDDARDHGEPVAILFASEGGIYGRFGFGVATLHADLRVARTRASFTEAVGLGGLRLVDRQLSAELLDRIAARATMAQPGAVTRSPEWWRYVAQSPARPGEPDLEVVVRAEEDGFAVYRRQIDPASYRGTLEVILLLALNPPAYAALWRYCLDVDLMEGLLARGRSVDEPLRFLLADPRAMESSATDGLWVRLIDVEAALNARTYADEGRVVVSVEDEFCPWNGGSYAIEGGRCRRTDAQPGLALPARALGACYLGGVRFTALMRAGVVRELRAGAAARADTLFASADTPWCPYHF